VEPVEERVDVDDRPEKSELAVELVEKQRSRDGHAKSAGVGEMEGEGEEPRVRGGEGEL
jgi:hypothetical protein